MSDFKVPVSAAFQPSESITSRRRLITFSVGFTLLVCAIVVAVKVMDADPGPEMRAPLSLEDRKFIFNATTVDKFPVSGEMSSAVIEVGPNKSPEFAAMARHFGDAYYLMVEPVVPEFSYKAGCMFQEGQCGVLDAAVFNTGKKASFSISKVTECSSMLSGGVRCAKSWKRKDVDLITLDDIIEKLPPKLPVRMLALDCQGADFQAAASLSKHVDRVANMLLECQDLPTDDKEHRLYPTARTCGEIVACVTQQWGWVLSRCTRNMEYEEYNCAFYNPKHPLKNKRIVHPQKGALHEIAFPAECPVKNFKIGG